MTAPLFFADADQLRAASIGDVVELGGAEGRHAATVRRLVAGEKLDLADGAGLVCSAEVTAVLAHGLQARVLARTEVPRPPVTVTVVQALAKGDRDERAVETMTEVGVDVIVPWQAGRSIVRWDSPRAQKAVTRWRTTAREAAKQARRAWLVDVPPLESTHAVIARIDSVVRGGGVAVVLHEESDRPIAGLAVPKRGEVVLVVGPEGGITPDEIAAFEAVGAAVHRLGPTVLRTSTAGTVAAAIVMASSGRWS
ncbi:MAG TPA: 16S rRNA (uracil(1498)-N(3))-methyltransferase [Acidothermaceae bacterium]